MYNTIEGERALFIDMDLPPDERVRLALIAINVISRVGVPSDQK